MSLSVFLRRVVLRNYKSIGLCDVRLGPLTYLVGVNGSGKSNFLDALHLVRDALTGLLDNALLAIHLTGAVPLGKCAVSTAPW